MRSSCPGQCRLAAMAISVHCTSRSRSAGAADLASAPGHLVRGQAQVVEALDPDRAGQCGSGAVIDAFSARRPSRAAYCADPCQELFAGGHTGGHTFGGGTNLSVAETPLEGQRFWHSCSVADGEQLDEPKGFLLVTQTGVR